MEGNKDTIDIRQSPGPEVDPRCPFCLPHVTEHILERLESAFVIPDRYPASQGHVLIVSVRHTPDFFSMTTQERHDVDELIRVMRNRICESDTSVRGFNIGINCGDVAGQTIMHAHIHLIPRRRGDVENPKGGVRGAIPGKMQY